MSNTFASSLVVGVLSDSFITATARSMARYERFSTDFSTEVVGERRTIIQVPVATAAQSVQINPTNYTTNAGSTLSAATVTMKHFQKAFFITQADVNDGKRLAHVANINAQAVAEALEAEFFSVVTESNFTAAVTGTSAGNLTVANVKQAWGALRGSEKNLIVSTAEFQNLLPSDVNGFDTSVSRSGYGFNFLDWTDNGFASAGSKLVGMAANRQAIAIASALPEVISSNALSAETIELPNGMTVLLVMWEDPVTRRYYGSYEVLFGVAAADRTGAVLIKTA